MPAYCYIAENGEYHAAIYNVGLMIPMTTGSVVRRNRPTCARHLLETVAWAELNRDKHEVVAVRPVSPETSRERLEKLTNLAYAAYGDAVDWKNFSGGVMPSWSALPEPQRVAWRMAVDAVQMFLQVAPE
jgi:hypothetical protein